VWLFVHGEPVDVLDAVPADKAVLELLVPGRGTPAPRLLRARGSAPLLRLRRAEQNGMIELSWGGDEWYPCPIGHSFQHPVRDGRGATVAVLDAAAILPPGAVP
jgi:hypothetical protein